MIHQKCSLNFTAIFFKKWAKPGLFLFILFFSHDKYSTNLTINDKSIDGVLGTRTRGSRMVGAILSRQNVLALWIPGCQRHWPCRKVSWSWPTPRVASASRAISGRRRSPSRLGKFFYKKMTDSGLFYCLFSVFQTNIIVILQQIDVKNVHPVYCAGIQTHDLWNMNLLP